MVEDEEDNETNLKYYLAREHDDHIRFSIPMSQPENWKTKLSDDDYAKCLDWFFDQAHIFHLHQSTILIAGEIFNRFIFSVSLILPYIKYAAAAALLIASKIDDEHTTLKTKSWHGADINVKQLCEMECVILTALDYRIPRATLQCLIDHFKKPYTHLGQVFEKRLAFISQLLLTNRFYLRYLPSVLARASINTVLETPGPEADVIISLCCYLGSCSFLQKHFADILSDGSVFADTFCQPPDQ